MIVSPFKVKKSLFPKKFVEKAERGTCHLDWRGVPPCHSPSPHWTLEMLKKQDESKRTNIQQVEESE